MLKTGFSRSAGLCRRVALSSRPLRIASSVSLRPSVSQSAVAPRLVWRAFSSQPRLYMSAEGDAVAAPPPVEEAAAPAEITRFADLDKLGIDQRIIDSITRGMGYETMSEVQSKTVSPALTGKDIVAQAKTGTGKTLAFLVPVVQRILAANPDLSSRTARSDDIQAIIMSPTRELAEQIGVEAKKLCKGTGIVVQTAVGGTLKSQMLRETRHRGCHLLVATPGRLNDLLEDPRSGIDAPNLSALVLDEADRMLDVGFDKELERILEKLPSRREKPRQTLLFSATIPSDVIRLAKNYVDPRNFEFIQTIRRDETPTHEKVPQHIVPCDGFANLQPTLLELMTRELAASNESPEALPFKAMVFMPTTASVELTHSVFADLAREMRLPRVMQMHSKLSQGQRTRAAENFRAAKSAILISSDVTARGMDFPNVSHVIQIGVPPDREQYIHRLGRTGRADKSGQGWLLLANVELSQARRRLVNLPLQRHTDLKCAAYQAEEGLENAPEEFRTIAEASNSLDHSTRQAAYQSFLGGALKGLDPQIVVDNLNQWAKVSWGMDTPPGVSTKLRAHLRGVHGLRFEDPRDSRDSRDGRDGRSRGRDSFGRGGRDGRDGRDRRGRDSDFSDDPFSQMERSSREPFPSRGGRGGPRRGGDRRRGGGGGFSAPRASF